MVTPARMKVIAESCRDGLIQIYGEGYNLETIASHPDVASFPVKVTPYQREKIFSHAPELMRMFIPSPKEIGGEGLTTDSYGQDHNNVDDIKGIQHKYPQTVLANVTDDCVANCRDCFKRYTAKEGDILKPEDYAKLFDYVKRHTEVTNVLISGGDPLVLNRKNLEELLSGLSRIEHLDFLRIGSKVLVDNPYAITEKLAEMLGKYAAQKPLYIVTHFNHPAEVTQEAIDAVRRLQRHGIMLMNQNPIRAGINDNAETISDLYNRLSAIGVRPYYAFHLMPIKGAAHLETAIDETFYLLEDAKEKMSGIAKTFRYVLPTDAGKVEVLGFDSRETPTRIYLKFHEAKEPENYGKMIALPYTKGTKWIDIPEGFQNKDKGYVGWGLTNEE